MSKPHYIRNKNYAGRNLSGKITVRHRKSADFFSLKLSNINFYANILLITSIFNLSKKNYQIFESMDYLGNFYYLRGISGLSYGSTILNFPVFLNLDSSDYLGSKIQLKKLLIGQIFCNIFSKSNKSLVATSSGTYCSVISNDFESNLVGVVLPSGSNKIYNGDFVVTVGRIAHELNSKLVWGKAGNYHHQGFRSTVRGVAMNPVDHPHGGRTKTNQPEKSPWGWVTKFNK